MIFLKKDNFFFKPILFYTLRFLKLFRDVLNFSILCKSNLKILKILAYYLKLTSKNYLILLNMLTLKE